MRGKTTVKEQVGETSGFVAKEPMHLSG